MTCMKDVHELVKQFEWRKKKTHMCILVQVIAIWLGFCMLYLFYGSNGLKEYTYTQLDIIDQEIKDGGTW